MQQMARIRCQVDGVLLLDKPVGITSNAAVQRIKRLFNAAKAGHVGTLDPLASGLLPVCLGEATKFSADTFNAEKSYEAEVLLGVTTTTGDAEGEVISRQVVSVSREEVTRVLPCFAGPLQQVPPMYSALKRHGKALYAYAREGQTVDRLPRAITIYNIGLLDFTGERFSITVRCSKGTYIRVLAEDIGRALGCGATLAALRRTSVGGFGLQRAVNLQDLEGWQPAQRHGALLPMDCLVSGLPALVLADNAVTRILQGQAAQTEAAPDTTGPVRLYDQNGRFLGLGEVLPGGRLLPRRLRASPPPLLAAADNASRQSIKIA